MLNIIICEDDNYYREKIENIIKNEVVDLKLDSRIELSTNNPGGVIKNLNNNVNKSYIYFLDVELKADINGIELAKTIRKYDSKGYIVFITSHSDLSNLVFKYKVQALEFISKYDTNALKSRICECFDVICNDFKNSHIKEIDTMTIDLGDRIYKFSLYEILFFETTNIGHKLRIHTINGNFEFYGKMKEIEAKLPSFYYKSHRSFLVNTTKIKYINKENHVINMINDEQCYVSSRYLKGLIEKCLK
ncbi:MAG: LytTR family DNA-binding domain-containing protein [Bacillota bacterium]|nr:LytTR family DNA-binding domain-containing protein [Bacillota bacterium]